MAQGNGPQAGGFLIAILILVGTIVGGLQNQPTIGLLGGFVAGVVLALLVWWRDRAKRGE